MDYLPSFKFKNRETDSERKRDEKSKKSQPPSHEQTPLTPSPASTRTIPPSRASTSSIHPPPASPHFSLSPRSPSSSSLSPTGRIATNTDPLPTSYSALEGHLNHHASQLQQLADRAETINEWIELDGIVLGRLVRDEEKRIEEMMNAKKNEVEKSREDHEVKVLDDGAGFRESKEWKKGVHFELLPRTNGGFMPMKLDEGKQVKGKRSVSAGEVPRVSGFSSVPSSASASSMMSGKISVNEVKQRAVEEHGGIREVGERIAEMKRWRNEVEKAVVRQREQFWRVEKAMGRKKGRESVLIGKENEKDLVEMMGKGLSMEDSKRVGKEEGAREKELNLMGERGGPSHGERKRWSKYSKGGRLPSQMEWEVMFNHP
ncbi:MAG: hypothetical protein Q9178_001722 [Gyalolechia marmorata]